jgi:hypothetical protein
MTDYGPKTGEKTAKNGHRLRPFTAGIKPFYSRFRPYKASFPTVGMIDLGRDFICMSQFKYFQIHVVTQ